MLAIHVTVADASVLYDRSTRNFEDEAEDISEKSVDFCQGNFFVVTLVWQLTRSGHHFFLDFIFQ